MWWGGGEWLCFWWKQDNVILIKNSIKLLKTSYHFIAHVPFASYNQILLLTKSWILTYRYFWNILNICLEPHSFMHFFNNVLNKILMSSIPWTQLQPHVPVLARAIASFISIFIRNLMSPDPVFDIYMLQTSNKIIEAIRFFRSFFIKKVAYRSSLSKK